MYGMRQVDSGDRRQQMVRAKQLSHERGSLFVLSVSHVLLLL